MDPYKCQFPFLKNVGEGNAPLPRQTLFKAFKVFVRDHTSERDYEVLRKYYHALIRFFSRKTPGKVSASFPDASLPSPPLQAGDRVRVKSKEEIEAILDHEGKTRGCGFMDGQWAYCGTVQRVLKPMERFVDERDGRVKKCSGLILLDGVACEGNTTFGRCDRSCLMFWRQEWLEKVS